MSLLRSKKTDMVEQLMKLLVKYLERTGDNSQKTDTLGKRDSSSENDCNKLIHDISTSLCNLRRRIAECADPAKIFETATNLAYTDNLFGVLFELVPRLTVGARVAVTELFSHLLRSSDDRFLQYVVRSGMLGTLLDIYTNAEPSDALTYGIVIRRCIEFPAPAKQLLYAGDRLHRVFGLAARTAFELASDAYMTLRDLFTRHDKLVGAYTDEAYDDLMDQFERLLYLDNYFTTRQTLRLMADMMLNPVNYSMMKRYISSDCNLKCVMSLLVNKSSCIQMQAFHVFKIFIANPNQTHEIKELLQINKQELIDFMSLFLDSNGDQEFINERTYVLQRIQDI